MFSSPIVDRVVEEKSRYLKDLFDRTYIKDVLERHEIKNDTKVLDILLDVLASGIGSLTNPSKLANTFKSERQIGIGSETIEKYIGYFEESFLIEKAVRYDVKGRKYIGTSAKYYYTDLGFEMRGLGSGNWRRLTSWKTYCITISSEEA